MNENEVKIILNSLTYGLTKGLSVLMADPKLLYRQTATALRDKRIVEMIKELGVPEIAQGEAYETIVPKVLNFLKEKGFVKDVKLISFDGNNVKLEVTGCMFYQTAKLLKEDGIEPMCPLMAITSGLISFAKGNEIDAVYKVEVLDNEKEILDITLDTT
ncbi:MAG: hypothetical protein ACP6IS_08285 [Candidatus Asgardarchaeia archaeon]